MVIIKIIGINIENLIQKKLFASHRPNPYALKANVNKADGFIKPFFY